VLEGFSNEIRKHRHLAPNTAVDGRRPQRCLDSGWFRGIHDGVVDQDEVELPAET
jgi:hypothetical protein